jgi:STE24 endopeptidase
MLYIRKVPKQLESVVPEETFIKAQEYGLAKSKFAFITGAVAFVQTVIILWFGLIPWLWDVSVGILVFLKMKTTYEVTASIFFLTIAQIYDVLTDLPFDLYSTFVIEQRFGFNKQTLGLFVMDRLKGLGVTAIIGIPVISALLHIIKWGGPHFYIYVWLFVMAVSFFFMAIYPNLIAPLFNKFTPLEEGELRTAVYELAGRLKFPLTQLFVVDGSIRSAHSNAYFYGFFKNKRIVLYDTLLRQLPEPRQVLAVLAHELGHWALNHNVWNMITIQLHMLAFFFIFGQFVNSPDLYTAFGFYDARPTLIGLVLFSFLYGPVEHLFSFLMHVLSRRFEYQADAFALDLGYSLAEPLTKIHVENLGNMCPDPWYSAYHYSHPTLVERLQAIERLQRTKAKKGQ